MRGIHPYLLSLGLLGTACAGGQAEGGVDVVARDSAGVRIVDNRSADRPAELALTWKADLVPPDSALTPVPWAVEADPEAGRLYVADWTAPRVVVFEENGEFAGEYARAGDGPGELRDATDIALDAEGVLIVWDARRGVLSRWSRDGSFVGEAPVPVSYWGQGFSVGSDGVVLVTSEQSGLSMVQRLVAAAPEGVRTIYELPVELVMMRLPGMEMPAPKIFMPSVIWSGRGDTLFVLDGPEYRIDRYERGVRVASFRRPLEAIRTTHAMAAATLAQHAREYGGFMSRTGLTAEQIVNAVGYEEVVAPVQNVVADAAGRLWVTRTRDGLTPGPLDIFDGHGSYQGTLDAGGIPVAFPSDSTLVLLQQDESGLPLLALYAIRWDAPALLSR
jgi:6-bladed beta-propeller